MKKILAVDIDGVLNTYHSYTRKILQEQYGIDTPDEIYYFMEEAGFDTPEKFEDFMQKHKKELDNTPVMPRAVEILNKLRDMGIEVVLLTARGESERDGTLAWLTKNQIPYDRLLMEGGTKANSCIENDFTIMIDDSPNNLYALNRAGINTLRFEHAYNKGVYGRNIHPVASWDDVYDHVLEHFDLI